jgi:hypothetical protein
MARASYSFVVIADRGLTAHFVLLPQAVNDAFGAATGGYHFFNVKANDRDPAGGGLTVVAVSAPAHGLAVVDPNGGVGYTPAAGYNGLDAFTYTVADARGNRDSAQVTALVGDAAAGHGMPLVHPVTDPAAGATAVFQAPSASVQVQLPGGFFTGTLGARDSLYIVFTPRLAPSAQAGQPPATLRFGGLEFDLSVLYNDQPLAAEQFAQPVTLRITYDAALLDGLKAESLHLRYWTGSEWSDEGVTVASHDLAARTIVLVLPHLSQYALFAEEGGMTAGLYLPFVER